jgi:hypothetical protein
MLPMLPWTNPDCCSGVRLWVRLEGVIVVVMMV